MTGGERVVRCLLGQPIDRIPYGVGIGWLPWGETLDQWRREAGDPALDPVRWLGFDASFATPPVRLGIDPPFEHRVLEETDEYVVWRDGRGIVMRNRHNHHSMPEWIEHPVKSRAGWEALKAERLRPDPEGRADIDWDAFRARIAATGEAVQVGAFPYGVFGTARDLMGVEPLLYAMHDDPELIRDMMQHLTTVWLAVFERVACEVRIDHLHIWEDMSGRHGPLVSPAMVRDFMMPCYDRIVAFARAAGVRLVSVDTDGDCSLLIPPMMDHGVNVMFPFEAQAGNDLLAVRRRHPSLGILGGLDKRALAGSRAAIDREIDLAAAMIARGRYVPGFDHLIPPDVPWASFRYAAERVHALCHRAVPWTAH